MFWERYGIRDLGCFGVTAVTEAELARRLIPELTALLLMGGGTWGDLHPTWQEMVARAGGKVGCKADRELRLRAWNMGERGSGFDRGVFAESWAARMFVVCKEAADG